MNRDLDFFEEEISQVIKGRCRGARAHYYQVTRTGRGIGLTRQARERVYEVYRKYSELLSANGTIDWDDVILRALDILQDDTEFEYYDHVFLDEAQDLAPVAIQLISNLLPSESQSLVIVADAAQAIYQGAFTWTELGISLAGGRSRSLDRNYRGTREIHAVAWPIIEDLAHQNPEEFTSAQAPRRSGPKPRLHRLGSLAEQEIWVANDIARLCRERGVTAGNVAVLARHHTTLDRIMTHLRAHGVPAVHFADRQELVLSDPSAKLLTVHSAKGLEFPVVYAVGFDQSQFLGGLPDDKNDSEAVENMERKLVFVALTRAMQDLTITCSRGDELKFLSDFPADAVEWLDTESEVGENSRPTEASVPTATPPPTDRGKGRPATLVERLRARGLSHKDLRPMGGALWVIGGPELEEMMHRFNAEGMQFRYAARGSKASGGKPAWYTKKLA
jgi:superfamily I DNA/RNA helicase